jgi:hypothetical protein
MKRFFLPLTVTALAAFAIGAAQTAQQPLPPMAIEVSVAPSTMDPYMLLERQSPYTYTCHVSISHPAERIGYASAMVIVKPGRRETASVKGDGFEGTFSVAVRKDREQATTEVEITRNGEFVTRQTSVVILKERPLR